MNLLSKCFNEQDCQTTFYSEFYKYAWIFLNLWDKVCSKEKIHLENVYLKFFLNW